MFFISGTIPVIRDKRCSQVYWDLLQQKGLYVNFLTEIHTICFGILCSLCQCWKIFLPGLFLKISEWNSRPCMEKLMWWMVEYSVTNNSFELGLNGNNLVKFVDQHAKWVGIRGDFLCKMQHLCQNCPQCV